MKICFQSLFLALAQQGGYGPAAPPGSGYEGGIWMTLLRIVLLVVFLALITLFLRLLFGPGGWLREKEWDMTEEERRKGDKSDR